MLAFYLSLIDTPEDRNKFEILYTMQNIMAIRLQQTIIMT